MSKIKIEETAKQMEEELREAPSQTLLVSLED